jgi:hypothetical protein
MKSFNQFLEECYLSEGVSPSERQRSPKEQAEWDKINKKEAATAERRANRKPSGAAADPSKQFKPKAKITTVASPAKKPSGAATDPWKQFPKKPQQQLGMPKTGPSSSLPGRTLAPAGGTTAQPALPAAGQTQKGAPLARRTGSNPGIPDAMLRGAQDAANKPPATSKPPASTPTKPSSSVGKPPALSSTNARRASAEAKKAKAAAGTGSSGKTIVTPAPSSGGKPPIGSPGSSSVAAKAATKTAGKGILKTFGKIAGPASAALDVADERSKGSGWLRSLAKGATVAAGGALGGAGGSIVGPVGTFGGAVGGSMAASKAFDVAAGANAKERKAIATANRQSQSGGAIKGIGGKTTFDTKKNTITTGTGTQRKTAQLGKTSVVTGPGGKQDVGYLAYKGGKAVYKRADTKSLAQTSSNPLERIGRSLFAGAYKQSDAANAAKKLAVARQSDAARNKALGVKMKPGG